jgi:hypothetical protein
MPKSKKIKLKLACLDQWIKSNIKQTEVKENVKKTYYNYKGNSNRGPRGKR